MSICFFATDLHGLTDRYGKLLALIARDRPKAVFLGGDLLPAAPCSPQQGHPLYLDFVRDYLIPGFEETRKILGENYPDVFLILGNDDPRSEEEQLVAAESRGLWHYAHLRKLTLGGFSVVGYSCVPPTPFLLKDWERYDVSRYVPPGSVSPEMGLRSVPVEESANKWGTIQNDVATLVGEGPLHQAVFLFHAPPYETPLDRAALDGKTYEDVALDPHVGSIAIRRFIELRQPLLTLHGHIHESARLTGEWKVQIGRTVCINGAHDGPELALVRFDLECPANATRELL